MYLFFLAHDVFTWLYLFLWDVYVRGRHYVFYFYFYYLLFLSLLLFLVSHVLH